MQKKEKVHVITFLKVKSLLVLPVFLSQKSRDMRGCPIKTPLLVVLGWTACDNYVYQHCNQINGFVQYCLLSSSYENEIVFCEVVYAFIYMHKSQTNVDKNTVQNMCTLHYS